MACATSGLRRRGDLPGARGLSARPSAPSSVLPWVAARPRLAAVLGALCIAFSGILYRYADVSPSTGTVYRCLFGLPLLALVAWLEVRRSGPMPPRMIKLSIVAGVFFAGDLLSWHHSIEWIGAGLATVLGNFQVVIVPILAWLVLRERPPRRVVLALPPALLGIVLISGIVGGGSYGENPPLGVGLGIVTGITYASYLLVIRSASGGSGRSAGPVLVATASTAAVAAAFGVISGELDPLPPPSSLAWLALLGVTAQSLGYVLISISLPRLPSSVVSVLLLVQPITSVVLTRPLLGETPSVIQLAGVVLVLAAVVIATASVRFRRRMPLAAGP